MNRIQGKQRMQKMHIIQRMQNVQRKLRMHKLEK